MDLKEKLNRINSIFGDLVQHPEKLSPQAKKALETAINKTLGQALAFTAEYYQIQRALNKGRYVEVQKHGDVTIGQKYLDGTWDKFAKTIECKSVSTDTPASIKAQLEKAFKQLAGKTGHNPRPFDARAVDLYIQFENPWPFSQPQEKVTKDMFVAQACSAIEDALSSAEGKELDQWILQTPYPATAVKPMKDVVSQSGSHRPVAVLGNQQTLPNALKVKVTWPEVGPRVLNGGQVSTLESFTYWRYAARAVRTGSIQRRTRSTCSRPTPVR